MVDSPAVGRETGSVSRTNRPRLAGMVLVAMLIAGGGVIWWGNGGLLPCGWVDRLLGYSDCERLAVLDGQDIDALAMGPDGDLLAIDSSPAKATAPPRRQQLLRIDARDGAVRSRTTLPDLDPRASWLALAVSPSGRRVVGGFLNQPTRVFDVASGRTIRTIDLHGQGHLGFLNDDVVLVGRLPSGPPAGPGWNGHAEAFAVADGKALKPPRREAFDPFSSGVSTAVSPDGRAVAVDATAGGRPGILLRRSGDGSTITHLTGPLDSSDPVLPLLAFSPDARLLAASFDDPPAWFQERSALFIWDTAGKGPPRRVATRDQWRDHTWSADSTALFATRYDPDARRTEIIRVRVAR